MASDSAAFVINEAAAKILGFENPVGEVIRWQSGWRSRYTSFTVLGVIKDMVMKSPYDPSTPAVYFLSPYGTNWINLRISPEMSLGEALPKLNPCSRK
jgi:putative ABC transport system permease protein